MPEELELLRKYAMNAMTELGAMISLTSDLDREENNILAEALSMMDVPEQKALDEQLYGIHCYLNELCDLIAKVAK